LRVRMTADEQAFVWRQQIPLLQQHLPNAGPQLVVRVDFRCGYRDRIPTDPRREFVLNFGLKPCDDFGGDARDVVEPPGQRRARIGTKSFRHTLDIEAGGSTSVKHEYSGVGCNWK